jgi:hypothetical protein
MFMVAFVHAPHFPDARDGADKWPRVFSERMEESSIDGTRKEESAEQGNNVVYDERDEIHGL